MNVHVTDPDFWERLAILDGEPWALKEQTSPPDELRFNGAILWLNTDADTDTDNLFEVYGPGGGHRYFVDAEGYVHFSEHHAFEDKVDLARDLGFRIWF